MARWLIGLLGLLMAGCAGGAVVFAPTPPPPDVSPLRYIHPSGAFTVDVPRDWPRYEQYTTTLAGAAFGPPGSHDPQLRLGVVNLGRPITSAELAALIEQYQTQIRPDAARYTETARQAMGDGSWRLSGLRRAAGGLTLALNTFVQARGSLLAVLEVTVPTEAARLAALQTIVNSFNLLEPGSLQPAPASALGAASASALDILHVSAWTTPAGVFFITGEVGNYGFTPSAPAPVRAALLTADGLPLAEAVDLTMGYSIAPGGFAPFSLRFGQGQPALAASYRLTVGGDEWALDAAPPVVESESLAWSDESVREVDGRLRIIGTVTHTGAAPVRDLRAVVTVFNTDRDVIAAGYGDITLALAPGESVSFQIIVPEMGGEPTSYILSLQGLP